MGLLAETKIRRKISSDPNNTKWTRDTTTFGQKILRSQGWQPGEFLGAQNSPHSELHSAASASYIRVALKDDMKGLGYDRAKADQVTGLDVFADLLNRLNGKSDAAVEEDRQARLVFKTHAYVENRWGPMRFVKGGLLVGDKLEELSDESDTETIDSAAADEQDTQAGSTATDEAKKSKKRKAASIEEGDDSSSEDSDARKKRRKEERKRKKSRADGITSSTEDTTKTEGEKAKKRERKEKKREKKLKKERARAKSDVEADSEGDAGQSSDRAEKRISKSKDKKKRSKDSDDEAGDSHKSKKAKKEKKNRRKDRDELTDSGSTTTAQPIPAVATGQSTPTGVSSGTSTPMGNRNFVRSKFIAQKRQAVMDAKALQQIFMLKA